MKRFITFLFPVLLLSACATDSLKNTKDYSDETAQCWNGIKNANGNMEQLNKSLDQEIFGYQEIIEEVLVSREKMLKLTDGITRNIDKEAAIPPAVLDGLNVQMKKGLGFSDVLSAGIARNECWYQASKERLAETNYAPLSDEVRLKGMMLALSGTLTLYDTYMGSISVLNEDDRIRRFVNQSDIGYGIQKDQVAAITDAALDLSNLLFVREEIASYKNNIGKHEKHYAKDDNALYLKQLIEQSPSYAVLKDASLEDVSNLRGQVRRNEAADNFSELNRSAVNGVSKFFGNLVGSVEERKGKLYGDIAIEAYLSKQLQAGDILLEKTPFRLTDKMIPGHWGHAAIWVGTDQELKQLGIWDHEVVSKYHVQITSGHGIVEALREDVMMNNLAHFMNIDDIAIIREPGITDKERGQVIIRALRQIGKEYDFNYDVETTDKIVCSQLVYMAYTDIPWPTSKVAGRYTISPDNVAFKAINNGPLKLVTFIHDGKRIDENAEALMEKLMQVK